MIAVWSALAPGASEPGLGRGGARALWSVGALRARAYLIFHDCGHGSFFQGLRAPTQLARAARVGRHVRHADGLDGRAPWLRARRQPRAGRVRLGRDHLPHGRGLRALPGRGGCSRMAATPLAPLLTWYVRMRLRLSCGQAAGRTAPGTRPCRRRGCPAMRWRRRRPLGRLEGDYLAMFLGVLLFHWQHVFPAGTSDRQRTGRWWARPRGL